MTEVFDIKVENKLVKDKRDINVYHHSTRGAHLISDNSSIILPLGTTGEEDYLHISVVSGPGNLKTDCLLNVPSWADFEFTSEGKITLTHSDDRMLLKIPPGPPKWEFKMTRPGGTLVKQPPDHVTIGDNSNE